MVLAVLVVVPLVLWAVLAGDALGPHSVPLSGARRPNVILILVDTLRADHLGMYGYERDTSPFLDAWATGAVVFDQAYAPSSWTRPSTVSLLTGLDPIHHRVEDRLDVIPPSLPLLGERLQVEGYATFAAITNPHVSSAWAFDRGFDVFDDLEALGLGTGADAVVDHVVARIDALAESEPFFLYLHLIDPHTPFDPPPPFDARFPADPEDVGDYAIAGYDGEIAFVDSQLRRLFEALRARGLEDGTMAIVTSDHGEELLERGGIGHGVNLFEEVLRVPLIVRFPDGAHAGARVAERVSLIDVVPTILSALRDVPAAGLDGRDLTTLLGVRERPWAARELFLSLRTTGPDSHLMRGLLAGPHKYLRRSRPSASEALFDLEQDPSEIENLARARAGTRERMAASLDAYLGRRSSGIHLRIVSEPDADAAGCEAHLETEGRFSDVAAVRLEPGDGFELTNDGRALRLACRLENQVQPTNAGSRLLPDEDGLSFRVHPPDAPIVLKRVGLTGGGTLPLRSASGPKIEDFPAAWTATAEPWAVRDMGEAMSAAGPVREGEGARAYLGVIPAPERHEGLSAELRSRLEALGYTTESEPLRSD